MIALPHTRGRTVAVMGLGRSGLVAAQALAASGATVLAWDDRAHSREAATAAGLGLTDLTLADWSGIDVLVLSPGIPHQFPAPHAVATLAKSHGVPIIGDVELLLEANKGARVVAVTGTNGKSTTTALIGHILTEAGVPVAIGGNLGPPALSLATLGADGVYVLELSSYQLELTPSLAATVAVLLNISADHLDRHGDMTGYVAAKARILIRAGHAVIGVDDDWTRALASGFTPPQTAISAISRPAGGVWRDGTLIIDATDGAPRTVLDLADAPALPGVHNAQNAAAAYAATRALGVDGGTIAAAIKSFPGLAHRQELIATRCGVRFVNDSKATNADAAARALACYDAIYWIAGGLPKAGGIMGLEPLFPRVRHAHLIGQAAPEFALTLAGSVPYTIDVDLASAVTHAFARALADHAADPSLEPVVLLSPAAASFDQFSGFEARGDRFRALVEKLGERGR